MTLERQDIIRDLEAKKLQLERAIQHIEMAIRHYQYLEDEFGDEEVEEAADILKGREKYRARYWRRTK